MQSQLPLATPINTIGVLTRIDESWQDGLDPLKKAQEIKNKLMQLEYSNKISDVVILLLYKRT